MCRETNNDNNNSNNYKYEHKQTSYIKMNKSEIE